MSPRIGLELLLVSRAILGRWCQNGRPGVGNTGRRLGTVLQSKETHFFESVELHSEDFLEIVIHR